MKLFPYQDVKAQAEKHIAQGYTIFQQWNCAHCDIKQTMDEPNKFFELGVCEECGAITDIKKHGMNFMATIALTPKGKRDFPKILAELKGKK